MYFIMIFLKNPFKKITVEKQMICYAITCIDNLSVLISVFVIS